MTLSDIQQKIYNLTNSSSSNYTNAQMLVDINVWYQRTAIAILRAQDDWDFDDSNKSNLPILTADLVANQQDYSLPVGCLKVKRIEIAYDGITNYKAEPIDVNFISKGTQQTQIQQYSSTNRPYYYIVGSSVFLYPIPSANTSNGTGMQIWVERGITEFSTSDLSTGSSTPGFDAPFHQIIAYGVALERAIGKNLENIEKINDRLKELFAELATYYGSKDEDMVWSLQPAYEDYGQLNYQTGNIRRIR